MTDVLAQFEALLVGMPAEEKANLDRLLEPELRAAWTPNPGPQTDAYYSLADILLYGGAAGGGKTDLLLGLALTQHNRSVLFRRTYKNLNGIEQRLVAILGSRDGYNGQDMSWQGDGRLIEMGALEKPGAEFDWQGRPHDLIGFDEGAQLSGNRVRFVMGWLRTTVPGQRCRVVIASNPPIGAEGEYLIEWFAPWLDPLFPNPAKPGELRWAVMTPDDRTIWLPDSRPVKLLDEGQWRQATAEEIAVTPPDPEVLTPKSRTFIPARTGDNPYIGAEYVATLQQMAEPLRSKLLKGDFLAGKEDAANQVIPSAWIRAAQDRWHKGKPAGATMTTVGLDVGGDGPDPTVLAPLWSTWFDELVVVQGIDPKKPAAVAGRVIETARHGARIHIDLTGGWGSGVRSHLEQARVPCIGIVFSAASGARTKDQKFGFFNIRAEMLWTFREALDPASGEDIALPPDRVLAAELAAPTWTLRGDRIVIESKDDIKKRLGSSTDRADAAILAWHRRKEAAVIQQHGPAGQWSTVAPDDNPFGIFE